MIDGLVYVMVDAGGDSMINIISELHDIRMRPNGKVLI